MVAGSRARSAIIVGAPVALIVFSLAHGIDWLVMHGMNDERVPIGQPMEFYRALKDRGKTVELVWYPREGHGNSEYYHQRDQIRRELEWMSKYVLGDRTSTSQ